MEIFHQILNEIALEGLEGIIFGNLVSMMEKQGIQINCVKNCLFYLKMNKLIDFYMLPENISIDVKDFIKFDIIKNKREKGSCKYYYQRINFNEKFEKMFLQEFNYLKSHIVIVAKQEIRYKILCGSKFVDFYDIIPDEVYGLLEYVGKQRKAGISSHEILSQRGGLTAKNLSYCLNSYLIKYDLVVIKNDSYGNKNNKKYIKKFAPINGKIVNFQKCLKTSGCYVKKCSLIKLDASNEELGRDLACILYHLQWHGDNENKPEKNKPSFDQTYENSFGALEKEESQSISSEEGEMDSSLDDEDVVEIDEIEKSNDSIACRDEGMMDTEEYEDLEYGSTFGPFIPSHRHSTHIPLATQIMQFIEHEYQTRGKGVSNPQIVKRFGIDRLLTRATLNWLKKSCFVQTLLMDKGKTRNFVFMPTRPGTKYIPTDSTTPFFSDVHLKDSISTSPTTTIITTPSPPTNSETAPDVISSAVAVSSELVVAQFDEFIKLREHFERYLSSVPNNEENVKMFQSECSAKILSMQFIQGLIRVVDFVRLKKLTYKAALMNHLNHLESSTTSKKKFGRNILERLLAKLQHYRIIRSHRYAKMTTSFQLIWDNLLDENDPIFEEISKIKARCHILDSGITTTPSSFLLKPTIFDDQCDHPSQKYPKNVYDFNEIAKLNLPKMITPQDIDYKFGYLSQLSRMNRCTLFHYYLMYLNTLVLHKNISESIFITSRPAGSPKSAVEELIEVDESIPSWISYIPYKRQKSSPSDTKQSKGLVMETIINYMPVMLLKDLYWPEWVESEFLQAKEIAKDSSSLSSSPVTQNFTESNDQCKLLFAQLPLSLRYMLLFKSSFKRHILFLCNFLLSYGLLQIDKRSRFLHNYVIKPYLCATLIDTRTSLRNFQTISIPKDAQSSSNSKDSSVLYSLQDIISYFQVLHYNFSDHGHEIFSNLHLFWNDFERICLNTPIVLLRQIASNNNSLMNTSTELPFRNRSYQCQYLLIQNCHTVDNVYKPRLNTQCQLYSMTTGAVDVAQNPNIVLELPPGDHLGPCGFDSKLRLNCFYLWNSSARRGEISKLIPGEISKLIPKSVPNKYNTRNVRAIKYTESKPLPLTMSVNDLLKVARARKRNLSFDRLKSVESYSLLPPPSRYPDKSSCPRKKMKIQNVCTATEDNQKDVRKYIETSSLQPSKFITKFRFSTLEDLGNGLKKIVLFSLTIEKLLSMVLVNKKIGNVPKSLAILNYSMVTILQTAQLNANHTDLIWNFLKLSLNKSAKFLTKHETSRNNLDFIRYVIPIARLVYQSFENYLGSPFALLLNSLYHNAAVIRKDTEYLFTNVTRVKYARKICSAIDFYSLYLLNRVDFISLRNNIEDPLEDYVFFFLLNVMVKDFIGFEINIDALGIKLSTPQKYNRLNSLLLHTTTTVTTKSSKNSIPLLTAHGISTLLISPSKPLPGTSISTLPLAAATNYNYLTKHYFFHHVHTLWGQIQKRFQTDFLDRPPHYFLSPQIYIDLTSAITLHSSSTLSPSSQDKNARYVYNRFWKFMPIELRNFRLDGYIKRLLCHWNLFYLPGYKDDVTAEFWDLIGDYYSMIFIGKSYLLNPQKNAIFRLRALALNVVLNQSPKRYPATVTLPDSLSIPVDIPLDPNVKISIDQMVVEIKPLEPVIEETKKKAAINLESLIINGGLLQDDLRYLISRLQLSNFPKPSEAAPHEESNYMKLSGVELSGDKLIERIMCKPIFHLTEISILLNAFFLTSSPSINTEENDARPPPSSNGITFDISILPRPKPWDIQDLSFDDTANFTPISNVSSRLKRILEFEGMPSNISNIMYESSYIFPFLTTVSFDSATVQNFDKFTCDANQTAEESAGVGGISIHTLGSRDIARLLLPLLGFVKKEVFENSIEYNFRQICQIIYSSQSTSADMKEIDFSEDPTDEILVLEILYKYIYDSGLYGIREQELLLYYHSQCIKEIDNLGYPRSNHLLNRLMLLALNSGYVIMVGIGDVRYVSVRYWRAWGIDVMANTADILAFKHKNKASLSKKFANNLFGKCSFEGIFGTSNMNSSDTNTTTTIPIISFITRPWLDFQAFLPPLLTPSQLDPEHRAKLEKLDISLPYFIATVDEDGSQQFCRRIYDFEILENFVFYLFNAVHRQPGITHSQLIRKCFFMPESRLRLVLSFLYNARFVRFYRFLGRPQEIPSTPILETSENAINLDKSIPKLFGKHGGNKFCSCTGTIVPSRNYPTNLISLAEKEIYLNPLDYSYSFPSTCDTDNYFGLTNTPSLQFHEDDPIFNPLPTDSFRVCDHNLSYQLLQQYFHHSTGFKLEILYDLHTLKH